MLHGSFQSAGHGPTNALCVDHGPKGLGYGRLLISAAAVSAEAMEDLCPC